MLGSCGLIGAPYLNFGINKSRGIASTFRHFVHDYWTCDRPTMGKHLCMIMKKVCEYLNLCPRINTDQHLE